VQRSAGSARRVQPPKCRHGALRSPSIVTREGLDHHQLEARGLRFVSETFDSGVCWQAICLDPDGNPLSLHHRYAPKDQRPDTP
jgi:hypothetical protein